MIDQILFAIILIVCINKNISSERFICIHYYTYYVVDIRLNILDNIKVLLEEINLKLKRTTSNCDDLFRAGYRTDGVYLLFSGEQFFNVSCEFNKTGFNWMVIISTYTLMCLEKY